MYDVTAPAFTAEATDDDSECEGTTPESNSAYQSWLTANGNAVAADLCGNNVTWSNNALTATWSGDLCANVKAVEFYAMDDCGNVNTTTASFTINDTTFPEITCPANISMVLPSGVTSTTVTIVPATATDNCGAQVEGVRTDGMELTDSYPLGVTTILWSATDDCGNVSTCTSMVTITDKSVVSGTVFHDTNRMTDNTVNGTGVNPGGLLFANLVDNAGNVVDAMMVNIDGTYSFANVLAGNYMVQITVNEGTTGSTMPETKLPAHWIHTGEHLGAGTGSDATADGLLAISVDGDDNVTEANFGIVKLPDLTPTITATKNVMNGITSFDLIIRITELNNINTDGVITVRLPVDSRWTLDGLFNPALTSLGSVTVHNSQWSYDGSDPNYHVFTTNAVISAGSSSAIGIKVKFDPQNARGSYTITSQLQSGSGGEMRVNNNADAEKLDYFPK
jgi:hypothetical protein